MYWISSPVALYFGKFVNLYDQSALLFVFPVTTCSTGVAPPFNTYLMLVGLFVFALFSSSQTLFTCTSTFSSGTSNVFATLNPDL